MSATELDGLLKVTHGTVESWIIGSDQPNVTQFNNLKSKLKRPAAIFFMDSPPESVESTVSMRFGFGATDRTRSHAERLAIRDSFRVGKFIGGLWEDLGFSSEDIPTASTNEDPEQVARRIRTDYLPVSIEDQLSLGSDAKAFRYWRDVIEREGILVFLYSLGAKSARGFSIATEVPPIIGVSTTWHPSVRVYTLFHELGHILTRTSSSCIEDTCENPTVDPTERWCESFAASFLMPREEIQNLISNDSIDPISTATWLANRLFVSRKSALLRLIDIQRAEWKDFRRLEARFERNKRGGGGNSPTRTRDITKKDTYGGCLATVGEAYSKGLVDEADIRTYLGMYPDELS